MLYGYGVFVCVHFQELSMYIWMCRGQVCDYFMGLVDVVYVGMLCLYDSVFCKMAELILCERLGMWGYVYASSKRWSVYIFRVRVEIYIYTHTHTHIQFI